ncbi:Serine/threonine-protein kinase PknB [Rubripirellula lacrimiformis]|uniref:Serine/threonine-protein kinase PknB n=1 Tax=Rubripirellula lacrimiformis TaxID=1930273 RepID=A0A517NHY7_9BACT|nr:serine/threonine-protein kinase [Rubripirellula lacrimiformis]QDT06750.1 Serine/threonine-protein kinase PknB [Rubripirellula lacrimiformis]
MSLFDSIKSAFSSSGGSTGGRIDVAGRFARQRTAVTGTMANFFVAKDREHDDRMVGVKILDIEKMELFEARFKGLKKPSEGQIAMQMKHPKVVETYEIGTSLKGEPVIVMEYVGGPSLQNIVVQKQEHHVTGRRMMMIRDMAEALKYVHSQGFIHRDICPRNFICLPDTAGVKLIDFGLTVPATPPFMAAGNRTGTPLYMSPEIVRRRPTDKRVDIFSFGVTCYCLICFQHPWQSEMLNGRAALQHDSVPPKDLLTRCPNVDPKLARTIMNALNPDVDKRTADMDQFLSGIRQVEKAFVD